MSDMTPAISGLGGTHDQRLRSGWATIVQVAVLVVLLGIAYRAQINSLMHQWSTDGNWSHGWLVPVFSLYFLFIHRDELARTPIRPNYLGLVVMLLSLLGLYYFSLKRFGYPQPLSIIPCLMGLALFLGGWSILRRVWFPIVFLACAIPIPADRYFELTVPLRRLASVVSGFLLGMFPGVETEVQGVIIDYTHFSADGNITPGHLNVEEACSGMRLMMSFCSLGLAMAYLGQRPTWQRLVMGASCVPIAVFCNMVRVSATGVIHLYAPHWSEGTPHVLLGLLMLPLALGLFWFLGYVLKHLFVEVGEQDEVAVAT